MSCNIWRFGDVRFDAAAGRLEVGGQAAGLDRNALAILSLLISRVDQPTSKDDLLEAGWPGRIVHENSLSKAIGRLRQTLGADGKRIEAVYGSGYRFAGPVQAAAAPPARQGGMSGRTKLADRVFGTRLRPAGALLASAALLLCAGAGVAAYAVSRQTQANAIAAIHERQAEALLTFLSADLLASADPYAGTVDAASLRSIVERSAASIDRRFRNDPATRIVLHRAVANAFSGWGEYEKAVAHLDHARSLASMVYRGARARETVPIDISLCQNMRLAGKTREAERICLRAEEIARETDAPQLAAAHIVRAKLLFEVGEYDGASKALGAALDRPRNLAAADRADAEWFQGLSLRKLARFDLAGAAFRRNLEMRRTLNGDRHPLTAWAHSDYGDFLVGIGEYEKAERELDAAQRMFDATLGKDHPESLSPAYSLAIAHLWRGEAKAARDLLRPMLARYRETLGADHFWTLYTMTELALAKAATGERAEAEALLREARQTGARILYGREAKAAHFHLRWARALAAIGKTDEAEDERRRAGEAMDSAGFAANHPWRARLHCLSARIAIAEDDMLRVRQSGQACLVALNAADDLPATYPALAEARELAGNGLSLAAAAVTAN